MCEYNRFRLIENPFGKHHFHGGKQMNMDINGNTRRYLGRRNISN